jgi:hypothetical protein
MPTDMIVQPLRPGLWRWTAPHPEWLPEKDRPGGWGQMVGCVYYEPPTGARDATVLIDPLAPPEGSADAARFWRALDRDIERAGLPVAILLGNHFHERSAETVFDRYVRRPGASIWARPTARGRVLCPVTRTFEPADVLPGGVRAVAVEGMHDTETVFYLGAYDALVFADSLIGIGGGEVRVPPARWAPDDAASQARYLADFRPSIARLLDLPASYLLVSHGELVQRDAQRALARALDAPAWGEE